MDVERWRRVQELFEAAADLPADEQADFLAAACPADEELRGEVEALLRADAAAGTFIEQAIRRGSDRLLAAEPDPVERLGRIGKYEIAGRIGEGGFGIVYRGRDPVLHRSVAVKTCSSKDERLRRRFFREGQIAAGLQHPNITTVFDLGIEDGIPYLVQELLDGEDLNQTIARHEPLTALQRLDVLVQVARGLDHAHGQGVLHRDVKPANIRRLPGGAVKIMDFGIAKLLHEVSDVTSQGLTLGTVGYLAPEQLRGGEVDRRTDVFAFGVLAYELMTYERPFKGATFSEVSYRLLNEEPTAVRQLAPDCGVAMAELIRRCLAKEPSQRCASFGEVIAVLEPEIDALRSGVFTLPPGGDGPPPVAARATGRPWMGPWSRAGSAWPSGQPWQSALAVAGAALICLGGLLAASGWRPWRRPMPPAPSSPAKWAGAARLETAATSGAAQPPAVGRAVGGGMAGVRARAAIPDRPEQAPGAVPRLPGAEGSGASARGAGGAQAPRQESSLPFERTTSSGLTPAAAVAVVPAAVSAASTTLESVEVATASPAARDAPAGAAAVSPGAAVATSAGAGGGGGGGNGGSAGNGGSGEGTGGDAPEGARAMSRGDLIRPRTPGAVPPRLLSRAEPAYPDRARRRRVEAHVLMLVLVDEGGHVQRAIVKKTDDPDLGFNQAARLAALRAVFAPATRDGIAGKMWTELPFDFLLKE